MRQAGRGAAASGGGQAGPGGVGGAGARCDGASRTRDGPGVGQGKAGPGKRRDGRGGAREGGPAPEAARRGRADAGATTGSRSGQARANGGQHGPRGRGSGAVRQSRKSHAGAEAKGGGNPAPKGVVRGKGRSHRETARASGPWLQVSPVEGGEGVTGRRRREAPAWSKKPADKKGAAGPAAAGGGQAVGAFRYFLSSDSHKALGRCSSCKGNPTGSMHQKQPLFLLYHQVQEDLLSRYEPKFNVAFLHDYGMKATHTAGALVFTEGPTFCISFDIFLN
ncbi:unnamed protein product [Prunus armeniaca]|uniref:Uncharacterized protein n=1 Tax=Prunus armeniaca TaxID=36596 RepID=A0A6J5V3C4_PRUAR|nr:unnamed protein product [Prunus armeniaca]